MIVLISESKVGKHHSFNLENKNVIHLSTKGSSIIRRSNRGYKISEKFIYEITKANPRLVLIGTDYDLQGTKIATLVKKTLDNLKIKSFRFALTNKGYMHIGEFLDDKRLKAIFESERKNIEFAKRTKKEYGISIGRKTFLLLGAINHFRKNLKVVKNINPKGSNTFTAVVKGQLNGLNLLTVVNNLQKLYMEGNIPYPRVDNDYIQHNPYDIYPHPNLREYGFIHYLITPIEEKELPLNGKTIWLEISNRRLMTPSTIPYYYNKFQNFFWNFHTLNPYPSYEKLLDNAEQFYLENIQSYVNELKSFYNPKLFFSKPIPAHFLNTKTEKELEDLFYELEYELYLKRLKENEEKQKALKNETVDLTQKGQTNKKNFKRKP